MLRGVPERVAEQLFADPIAAGGGLCSENWSLFAGSISCDNTGCPRTCWVQVNKMGGMLGWADVGDGKVVVNPNWAYRCNCH